MVIIRMLGSIMLPYIYCHDQCELHTTHGHDNAKSNPVLYKNVHSRLLIHFSFLFKVL